eukprot:TRINITY_DN111653_c0_g1_i1.p1 TRINITY_DN111653_c0_g1~~TRINITY_DN111653_c0_g1_i1.p1  ORF type:complete len:163 (+),score=30.35 TRINITY_DN111653_c0_g1_i1:32-520(+)
MQKVLRLTSEEEILQGLRSRASFAAPGQTHRCLTISCTVWAAHCFVLSILPVRFYAPAFAYYNVLRWYANKTDGDVEVHPDMPLPLSQLRRCADCSNLAPTSPFDSSWLFQDYDEVSEAAYQLLSKIEKAALCAVIEFECIMLGRMAAQEMYERMRIEVLSP